MVSTFLYRTAAPVIFTDRAWSLRQLGDLVQDCTQRDLSVSPTNDPKRPIQWLPYNTPERVVQLAKDVAEAMHLLQNSTPESVDSADIELAKIAAFFSGSLPAYSANMYRVPIDQIGLHQRRPWAEDCVEQAAQEASNWLRLVPFSQPEKSATDDEIGKIVEIILATKMIEVNGRRRHINLNRKSSIAARMLAMVNADQAGLHGFASWKQGVVRQWLEADVASTVLRLSGAITEETQGQMRQRILDHLDYQYHLALKLPELVVEELVSWLPEEARLTIWRHFCQHTAEVVAFGDQWQRQCHSMPTAILLEEFGLSKQ
jgi:hypothetical protein